MVQDIATLLHSAALAPDVTSLITYIFKGLGSVIVALGAYLGFRKLPSG